MRPVREVGAVTLEPRCPLHPDYAGTEPPQAGACSDCWELFRRKHEDKPIDPRRTA